MKIGYVAELLKIPPSTIRYYERVGLIDKQPRISGRRDFNKQAIFALRFVQIAQQAGFSISDMKKLLENYDQNPSPAGMWKSLAEDKRKTVRGQIKELRKMDRILGKLLECECGTLNECVEFALKRSLKADEI